MKLRLVEYSQDPGTKREWNLHGLSLGDVNLLVGPNASGKSRSLAVIQNLAKLFANEMRFTFEHGSHRIVFRHENGEAHYNLSFADSRVIEEEYSVNGKVLLRRGIDGIGTIYAEKVGSDIEFQTPDTELAAVARRDNLQHSFFQPLYDWGKSTYYYPFGTALGKTSFGVIVKNATGEPDPKDPEKIISVFRRGLSKFGDAYKQAIIRDMEALRYPIVDIGTCAPHGVKFESPMGDIVTLFVQETDLPGPTDQFNMSQGMFRALSIIAHLNYTELAARPTCIIIDDIGEGLDHERSCALIRLLVGKAEAGNIQLIMSTNDRFVMNAVPLTAWSVLRRDAGQCRVFNYQNSKAKFDEFAYTGLSNFEFFASNFVEEGLKEDEEAGDLRRGADGAVICPETTLGDIGRQETMHSNG